MPTKGQSPVFWELWTESRYSENCISPTFMYLASTVFLSAAVRLLLRKYKVSVPYTVFIICIGFLIGGISRYCQFPQQYFQIIYADNNFLIDIYLPTLIFKAGFCIDLHTFSKCWLQVILISVVGFIIQMFVVGILVMNTVSYEWDLTFAVLLGALSSPIYVPDMVKTLRNVGYHTRHITCLLEGESMIGLFVCVFTLVIVIQNMDEVSTAIHLQTAFWFIFNGILVGLILGKLTAILITYFAHNPIFVVMVTIANSYFGYYVCYEYLNSVGELAVMGISLFIGLERPGLPKEVDSTLIFIWDFLSHLIISINSMNIGIYLIYEGVRQFSKNMYVQLLEVLTSFIIANVGRFLAFVIISPLLARIEYRMTFKKMLVLVWGGYRSIVGLILLELFYGTDYYDLLYVHVSGIFILVLLINSSTMATVLKYLGVSDISLTRHTNMDSCIKRLMKKKTKAIVALKMNRFFSDANWPLIKLETTIRHPYKSELTDIEISQVPDDDNKIVLCPECSSVIPKKYSEEEFSELTREARLRVLMANRISVMKQYESGMISKTSMALIIGVIDSSTDTEEVLPNFYALTNADLKKTFYDGLLRFIGDKFGVKNKKVIRKPRTYWRRICYKIVTNIAFDTSITILVAIHITVLIALTVLKTAIAFSHKNVEKWISIVLAKQHLLESLNMMIENPDIRKDMAKRLETDRLNVTKQLGLIQKDRPWVAITVKSKQAIKTTLNGMKDSISDLKVSGRLDDNEYKELEQVINDKIKQANRLKTIAPNEPKVVFKEIQWMPEEEGISELLFKTVERRKFDTGEYVFIEGEKSEGVYVMLTGLLKLTYVPRKRHLIQMEETGELPVIDYIMNNKFNEKLRDYVVSGNTIGELSLLTRRPYNCDIFAEVPSELFFIPEFLLIKCIINDANHINGLESRMWKHVSLRLAMRLLMEQPSYQALDHESIKVILERSFIPRLDEFKNFMVDEMIEDIVLIEGVLIEFHTGERFTGPCYIERTARKFILPKSSKYNLQSSYTVIKPILLIIPAKDYTDVEIMTTERSISQMVVNVSMKCLKHSAKARYVPKDTRKRKLNINLLKRRLQIGKTSDSDSDSLKGFIIKPRGSLEFTLPLELSSGHLEFQREARPVIDLSSIASLTSSDTLAKRREAISHTKFRVKRSYKELHKESSDDSI